MAIKHRARKQEDKRARRAAILATATQLLDERQFSGITMADIARECGLAKGTLYLYFRTKEELFLVALEDEFAQWFDHVTALLAEHGPLDSQTLGRMLARSLAARETLADLLAVVHSILERNIEPEAALKFKRMLRDKLVATGGAIERVVPRLRPGQGIRFLLRAHALVVGLRQLARPAPVVAEILQREELAVLRVDFEDEFAEALASLLIGMER